MAKTTRAEFLYRMEPVFIGRSDRTASGYPAPIGKRCDILMPKRGNSMADGWRVSVRVRVGNVLQNLAGMFLPGYVILLPLLFTDTMSVRGSVM